MHKYREPVEGEKLLRDLGFHPFSPAAGDNNCNFFHQTKNRLIRDNQKINILNLRDLKKRKLKREQPQGAVPFRNNFTSLQYYMQEDLHF